jgi:uncharacterized repeat protein (TIGR03803 family)
MKTMTTNRNTMLAVLCALLLGAANAPAQFNLLHSFLDAGNGDGSFPQYGAPTVSGSTLYGMTYRGGFTGYGSVFKMNTNGTGYTLLYNFNGFSDGRWPYGSLTLDGSTLYGMTPRISDGGGGTAFKMNTDGTGFTLLHSFAGGVNDGLLPYGSLTLYNSMLFGMALAGGARGGGTAFRMNTDGTGFTTLHSFAGGVNDGSAPFGSLTSDNNGWLYGMTQEGGSLNRGTVFGMNVDGNGFAVLHSFKDDGSDGKYPSGSLTLSGSTLYGMTWQGGGWNNGGTIFKMNTDGTGFTLLHTFNGGVSDGLNPYGSLTLSGSTLYGVTQWGGVSNCGTAFQINTNGTGFSLLHSFAGGVNDGKNPKGSLTLSGSTLYGMTYAGGVYDAGTAFSIVVVPEPSSMGLVLLGLGLIGWRRLRLRRES